MHEWGPFLADIWLFLIGFFLLYYAVADGADLGVGILSLFSEDDEACGFLMSTLHATWHGNQTWLVLLGGMLFGAFPLFYSLVLSSLYIPIVVMLFGLVFRGVAFEFRENSTHKYLWGLSFGLGSLIVTLAQGFALGGLLGGLAVQNGEFIGSVWSWFSPFSMLVTTGVVAGYVMLGTNYLIMKTVGALQDRCYRLARTVSVATLLIAVAVHVWTIALYPYVARKWTVYPDVLAVASFPSLTVVAIAMYFRALHKRREVAPLLWNAAIVLFSFIGLSIEMYPNMIPHVIYTGLTVSGAAASPPTLVFMLVVTAFLIPVILMYTAYEFWVFRGKTLHVSIYHEAHGNSFPDERKTE